MILLVQKWESCADEVLMFGEGKKGYRNDMEKEEPTTWQQLSSLWKYKAVCSLSFQFLITLFTHC